MGIDCAMYDRLELAAMHGETLRLSAKRRSGHVDVFEGRIASLTSKNGQEYLITPNNQLWALEGLMGIEDIPQKEDSTA